MNDTPRAQANHGASSPSPRHAPARLTKEPLMTNGTAKNMQIKIDDRDMRIAERLRERLDRAAKLRCPDHDQSPVSVTIHGRENGWFDAQWTTCCESLEQQARTILKDRC